MSETTKKMTFSSNNNGPKWFINEEGMWIDMELDTPRLQPPVKASHLHQTQSTPGAEPQLSFNSSLPSVLNSASQHVPQSHAAAEPVHVMNAPSSLEDIGKRIFKELYDECEAARKEVEQQPVCVQDFRAKALEAFMKAKKWRVVKVKGKTGFYAQFSSKEGPPPNSQDRNNSYWMHEK